MSSTEPTATQTALLLWAFTGEWSILKWIVACTYFLSKFSLQSINEQQQNEPPILTNSSLLWSKSGWEHIIFPEKSPFTKGTKINHMIIRDKGDFLFFLQLAWQQLTSQLNQRKIPSPHARKIPHIYHSEHYFLNVLHTQIWSLREKWPMSIVYWYNFVALVGCIHCTKAIIPTVEKKENIFLNLSLDRQWDLDGRELL